jgi:H+/Cl- antiporter ClcA
VSQPEPLSGSAYLRLVALGAVIGIPAAFLAALFLAVVHDVERWLWDSLPSALGHSAPPWYLVILLPAAGACVVVLARRLLPGDGGHPPLEGIGGGATPVSHAPGIALAAIGTLSFSAVLGPEAPLIALGSVVGMVVALSGAFGEREQLAHVWFDVSPTLAVAVGAAAGMAAGTRLLITSTLFASLLVGTNGLDAVPAAVLAACAAWITAQALDRRAAAAEAGLPVADPG